MALVLSALWPTALDLVASWRNTEAYEYAWLVLPMLVYVLVWHHRETAGALTPNPGFTGVAVAAGAALCWGAATLMNIDVGRHLALVLALHGIAMAALGWRAYWQLFPALALLFFMVPSGDVLQPLLRLLTAKAIEWFAVLAGLPHSVDGFVIHIGTNRYIVVDECSGLAFVTLASFLGYSLGLLLYRSLPRIAALSALGALLGIFCNVLRVNAIVLIDWMQGSQMELTAHGKIQWIALFLTLGLLLYVLSRLPAEGPVAAAPAPAQQTAGSPGRRLAPVVAGLAVVLMAGVVMRLPADAPLPPHEAQLPSLPAQVAGWELAAPAARWSFDPQRDTGTLAASYRRDGREMRVVIVQTLSPAAKLQPSQLLLGDRKAWHERRVEQRTSCTAAGCLALVHTAWQRDKSRDVRHVFHAYSTGGFTTDSRFALRAIHGWHKLTGRASHPRLIGLVFDNETPDSAEVAGAMRSVQSAVAPAGP